MKEREFNEEELDNIIAGNSQLHHEEMFEKKLMENKDMFRENQKQQLEAIKQELEQMHEENRGCSR